MSANDWADGDVVAIAKQFHQMMMWDGERIRAADPEIDLTALEASLRSLQAVGLSIRPEEMGPDLPDGLDRDLVEPHLKVIRDLLDRIRTAGARTFTKPGDSIMALAHTIDFPREYDGLPGPEIAPADKVRILHFGDMPTSHPAWKDRVRIASYVNLEALHFFGNDLVTQPLGFDLASLTRLRLLDLRQCGLRRLPGEVLDCVRLETLLLSDNPLFDVDALLDPRQLPTLRRISLARTRVTLEMLDALSRARTSCLVDVS